MTAPDGEKAINRRCKYEQLLRIIQSIPSPKAEPFKLWLAQMAEERIEETIDPELTIDRALETYLRKATAMGGSTSACKRFKCARNWPTNGTRAGYRKGGIRDSDRRNRGPA